MCTSNKLDYPVKKYILVECIQMCDSEPPADTWKHKNDKDDSEGKDKKPNKVGHKSVKN